MAAGLVCQFAMNNFNFKFQYGWAHWSLVRAHLRRRIYGQSESNTMEGRSLAAHYVAKLHFPRGGVSMRGKKAGRDGGSDTI
jgi:hypothetical protein